MNDEKQQQPLGPMAYVVFFAILVSFIGGGYLLSCSLSMRAEIPEKKQQQTEATVRAHYFAEKPKNLLDKGAILWGGRRFLGYVYQTNDGIYYGAAAVGEKKKSAFGSRIKITYDSSRPEISVPAQAEPAMRWKGTAGAGIFLLLITIALLITVMREGTTIKSARQSISTLVLVIFLSFLFIQFRSNYQQKLDEMIEKTQIKGQWGSHEAGNNGGILRIRVISRKDDTTAYAQRRSNEVNFPGLAFGSHTWGMFDAAFLRFFVELPKDVKIKHAHLELICNSNRLNAGSKEDTFAIESIRVDKDFGLQNYRNYRELMTIVITGGPVIWQGTPWKNQEMYQSPELKHLVQKWIERSDYKPGQYFGLRITPSDLRRYRPNLEYLRYAAASGSQGAVLHIEYE